MSSAQMSDVASKHENKLDEMLNQMANENHNVRKSSHSYPRMISGRSFSGGHGHGQGGHGPRGSIQESKPIRSVPKCRMANYTNGDVFQQAEQDWCGSNVGAYPIRIIRNAVGGFRHGHVDKSEGAVVYRGSTGADDCSYILAWKASDKERKVYVETGPVEDYKNISWSDIKNKLNNEGKNKCYAKDPDTGAEVSAKVGSDLDFTVAAVFDVTNY